MTKPNSTLPYQLDKVGVKLKRVATNGIHLNVAEAGEGPVVFLLHGFPEGWASWGPQITYLVEQGYKVVAPEMRGYGESDAPQAVEAYDTVELAADVAGLIDAYGEEKSIVIGHDWGCIVAWHVAWLHPEKVKAVAGLSVPWFGRGEQSLLDLFATALEDRYFYIRDFQRPIVNDQLNKDHRETLTKVLQGHMDLLNQGSDDASFLDRIDLLEPTPSFIPNDFLDYLINRYSFNGFEGPLNWYRNFKRTFELTDGMSSVIKPPAMFLTGTQDWPHQFALQTGFDMKPLFSDLRINESIDAGHWLGQEKPDWINGKISEFLGSIKS